MELKVKGEEKRRRANARLVTFFVAAPYCLRISGATRAQLHQQKKNKGVGAKKKKSRLDHPEKEGTRPQEPLLQTQRPQGQAGSQKESLKERCQNGANKKRVNVAAH